MSFGVGDSIAVAQLAWKLYTACYKVGRGAPQEFKLVMSELQTMHATMEMLRETLEDSESVLSRSGEDRQTMMGDMLRQVKDVLEELERTFKKHSSIGTRRSGLKGGWDRFKWTLDAKEVDGLRTKLAYHNGLFSLLLTCAGNSSLQRLEESTKVINEGIQQISDLVSKTAEAEPPLPLASSSAMADTARLEFSEKCMEAAEVRQRWWSIPLDRWVHAGRWWLMKAHDSLSKSVDSQTLDYDAYINLHKASWIVVDVIGVHPQLGSMENRVRFEVQRLMDGIKLEFREIAKRALPIPRLKANEELQIWSLRSLGPTPIFQLSDDNNQKWEMRDEYVIFRAFVQYHVRENQSDTDSMLLFLADKKTLRPRFVVHDQHWTILLELTYNQLDLSVAFDELEKGQTQTLQLKSGALFSFSTTEERNIAFVIGETYSQRLFRYILSQYPTLETHYALFIKTGVEFLKTSVLEHLLNGEVCRSIQEPVEMDKRLLAAAINLAQSILANHSQYKDPPHNGCLSGELLKSANNDANNRYQTFVDLLKQELGITYPTPEPLLTRETLEAALEFDKILDRTHFPSLWWFSHDQRCNVPSDAPQQIMVAAAEDAEFLRNALKHGLVDPNCKDEYGRNGLYFARNLATAKAWIEMGADVESRRTDCDTALHTHVAAGNNDIVRTLVDLGADIEARTTESGWTPLHIASKKDNVEIAKILIGFDAQINNRQKPKEYSPLHEVVIPNPPEHKCPCIPLSLDKRALVDATDKEGNTPLHFAAELVNASAMLKLLLQHGACVNARNFHGDTPLHIASRIIRLPEHTDDIIKTFIRNGADTEILNKMGETPLLAAAKSTPYNYVNIWELINNGAKWEMDDDYVSQIPRVVIEWINWMSDRSLDSPNIMECLACFIFEWEESQDRLELEGIEKVISGERE